MSKQTKKCPGCGAARPLDAFSRDKSKRDGLTSRCKACHATYRAEHKEKYAAYSATYRAENKDKLAAYRAANKDRLLAQRAAYYAEHREEERARVAAHRAANPHVGWAHGYRRRVARFNLEEVVEDFTRDDVIAKYGDACVYCGWGDFERLDHYIPVKAGGPHTLDNVRPACATCDRDKYLTPGPNYEARILEQSKARHPAMGGAR